MAKFIFLVLAFVVAAIILPQSAGAQTVHVVGDNLGWTVRPGGAQLYANWANANTFVVGDVLSKNFAFISLKYSFLFLHCDLDFDNYCHMQHSILSPTSMTCSKSQKASFDSCTSSNSIGSLISTGPANITLNTAGEHYYICTIGRHCLAGQKLAITVSATAGATPPSTISPSATPTTPSPTNSPTDDCAPTPSPGDPTATSPTSSTSGPSPPGSSSSSNLLANVFLSILAVATVLLVWI